MIRRGLATSMIVTLSILLSGCDAIDRAIGQLQEFNHTLGEITDILNNLSRSLDRGVYRDQVQEVVGRAGQVVGLTQQAAIDFIRDRVIEDLARIKAARDHKPFPPPRPVLATIALPEIDYSNPEARTTLKIVGWNLNTAANDPRRYSVVINGSGGQRLVGREFISFQGEYQLTINVSTSGVPLQPGDTKMVFNGYEDEDGHARPFEVSIIRAGAGTRISSFKIETNQNRDEKDANINARFRLDVGGRNYVDFTAGKHHKWPDNALRVLWVAPAQIPHKPCETDFFVEHPSGLYGRITRAGQFDPTCHYFIVQPRLLEVPPLAGQADGATFTMEALDDSSGWAGHVRILALVTGESNPRVLTSQRFAIHKDGNGGTAEWRFPW